MGSRMAVWGDAETCARGLTEKIQAGAEMLMLNPMFDQLDHMKALPKVVAHASEYSD